MELGPEVEECAAESAELLAGIAAASLPCNFLDQLIHELGGPGRVAEMTGRWAPSWRRARLADQGQWALTWFAQDPR